MPYGITKKISRFRWLLRKRWHTKYASGDILEDTTSGQGRIIALLKMHDGIGTKDISYLLGISVVAINELLAKLEKNGYLIREQMPEDKRYIVVKLTDKGRQTKQEETDDDAKPDELYSCLSDTEQQTFSKSLDKLIAALQTELGIDGAEIDERMREWREHRRFHRNGHWHN